MIGVRLTVPEREALEQAAARHGATLSTFARDQLVRATRLLSEPYQPQHNGIDAAVDSIR
jgi:uncharacterized protein (DUF1778 family)